MQEKKNISAPKIGMNRDAHPSQLQNTEYTFCMDCNTENETGDVLNITNEPSNYFSVQFPQGYKVVGYKKHTTKDITYFFLTNIETGYSSIGYVTHTGRPILPQDTEETCEECNQYSKLPVPLEEVEQVPFNQYIEYFNDLCNKDLNFSINHPIKHIEIKADKLGTNIYFADGYNPDRVFNADNTQYYKEVGVDVCGEDNTTPICVNTDRMRQDPIYTIPVITPERLQIGGNLRMGTYSFAVAYCDKLGNEISDYYSVTQPIKIFDENNRVLTQPELDSFTNFAIRLTVDNLDTQFKYYKVVVIERVAINQAESYFEEGIHPTTDKEILYTSTQTGTENLGGVTKRISFDKFMAKRTRYEHSRGIEIANNRQVKWGLTGKKFPNLQPVVNLIGGFLKWNTGVAKETLYKDPIACSKYVGYMREEVQPFAIRFFNKDGSEYPVFPLVGRPSMPYDNEIVNTSDKSVASVLNNGTNCSSTDRNKKWQFYNTAQIEGTCSDFLQNGEEVEREEQASCVINNVGSWDNDSFNVSATQGITNLRDYVNSNLENVINPNSPDYLPELAPYLTADYPGAFCSPTFNSGCDSPQLDTTRVQIQSVVNEVYSPAQNTNISDYPSNISPSFCQPFRTNPDGTPVNDTSFQTDYALSNVYFRQGDFNNEQCINAVSVVNNNPQQQPPTGYFNNYYGAETIDELTDSNKNVSATDSEFQPVLHKGALWFKVAKNGRNKILLEVTKNSPCTQSDDISSLNKLRYSIYQNCNDTVSTVSGIFNASTGVLEILDTSTYSDTFYIAIDAPIVATSNSKYRTAPPCACFSVLTRDLQTTGTTISFDSIIFQQINTYTANCTYNLPKINECFPVPYQHGSFSYWESTDTYPDNAELYDSSNLIIEPVDLSNLSEFQKQQFRDYYTDGTLSSVYNLNPNTDLRCKPIRFPKFPSNIIAPFMGTINSAPFAESLIFPMGVNLDNNIVNTFLDVAVKNKLLTQKQRDEIQGYEILKGDNSIHKSIVSNSIGFDMYKYDEKGDAVLYANYPLNDLGVDQLNLEGSNTIPHPYGSTSNFNFSVLSPELSLNKPTLPTEIIVSGYQLGHSRTIFSEVEDFPKYTLLTGKAKDVAFALALLEVEAEHAITVAQFLGSSGLGQGWSVAGLGSVGGNFSGMAVSTGALIALGIQHTLTRGIKIGQYRLQWLETIERLGQPKNHSAYAAVEGHTNIFFKNEQQSEQLRGLTSAKYLKAGRYKFIDEKTGDSIKINNKDREYSTFISTGKDFPVNYPSYYSNYDNNLVARGDSSRSTLEDYGCALAIGQEAQGKSAAPYITLKNYIPNQFGTIDSVKWLTTSYKTELELNTECEVIYGGTVYITRDVQKRKLPLFRANAFGQADLTPFNHELAKNIGTPRFYVNYRADEENTSVFDIVAFPDINTSSNLSCANSNYFYYRESSKFYLYYYGFMSYMVESEVNTNFRYGRREVKDQYYPDIQGDIIEFTQEKNLSIKEPVTYFYNSVYSRPVIQTPYNIFPAVYEKELYDKINDAENGIIWSLQDNSENDLTDPWLTFLPLNKEEFDSEGGKLISVEELGTQQLVFRFENGELVLPIENLNNSAGLSTELGTGGLFVRTSSKSYNGDIGYGGTQNTDYLKTPYGYYSVDAKRGQIFQRNGQELTPISDILGNRVSGLKNWFRKHLPFKILKQYPDVDIDNKYKGIGISLGYDNKFGRIFLTKRDYKVINDNCVEYDPELGFVINETLCGGTPDISCPIGYTYNTLTQMCEKEIITDTCPEGYIYNSITGLCETQGAQNQICPDGYTYNAELQLCSIDVTQPAEEETVNECIADMVFIMPQGDFEASRRAREAARQIVENFEDQINNGNLRIGVVYLCNTSSIYGGNPRLYTGTTDWVLPASEMLQQYALVNPLAGSVCQGTDIAGALRNASRCLFESPQARVGVPKRVLTFGVPLLAYTSPTPTPYMGCSFPTTDPGGYPNTLPSYLLLRSALNFRNCMYTTNNVKFDSIIVLSQNEGNFYDDLADSEIFFNAEAYTPQEISAEYTTQLENRICDETTIYTCPDGCELVGEECICENTVVAPTCGGTVIPQPDGNAICVLPSQSVPSLCEGCEIIQGEQGCPEGYTYNSLTQRCEKQIPTCFNMGGYFVSGVFTNPGVRIWNPNGSVVTPSGSFIQRTQATPDGKVVVVGSFNAPFSGIYKILGNGQLDTSFNAGIGISGTLPFTSTIQDIDIYPDGRIIIVGSFTSYNGTPAMGIARLMPNGDIDTTFNTSTGFTTAPYAVKIVEGEKILVGAKGDYKGTPTKSLIKINPDASVDTSFGGGQRMLTSVGTGTPDRQVYYIEKATNGYYIGGSFTHYDTSESRGIVKILPNGSIDASFNIGEGFKTNVTADSVYRARVTKIKELPNGRVIVSGAFSSFKNQAVQGIVRLMPNGNLDSTFNNNKVVQSVASNTGHVIDSFDIINNTTLVIGGLFLGYGGNTQPYIVYTDLNGFESQPSPYVFNQRIYDIETLPPCQECERVDCEQIVQGDITICSCPPTFVESGCVCIDQEPPMLIDRKTPIWYDNTNYFKDVSWTISYSPREGWKSYHSKHPDYYINHTEYFDTGYNWAEDEETLWSHFLDNYSFGVFCGKKYPWIVEYPISGDDNASKFLNSVTVSSEARRFMDEFDYNVHRQIGFEKAVIYNSTNNSSLLELVQQKTLNDIRNYPQTTNSSQKILYNSENNKHTFNYFYNRVKNQDNGLPIFLWDDNMINKELNLQALSFKGKKILERIRNNGDYILLRLINDQESRLSVILRKSVNAETIQE